MLYKNNSLEEFTSALASSAPVPGGGGAAGLLGSLGASLGSMAGQISCYKKNNESAREKLELICSSLKALRLKFLDIIDKDAEAFYPLSKAYALSNRLPERAVMIEKASIVAASVPYEALSLCCEAVELLEQLYPLCSRLLVSDIACAAACCSAAINCCIVNVLVNTSSLDTKEARDIENHAKLLSEEYVQRANILYSTVKALF